MPQLPLQAYDLMMVAVLVLCTLFGAWKGMAWQVAALASIIVSAQVAIHLSGPLAPYLSDQTPWNRCIAMLVLYLVTSLGIWILFRAVANFIDRVRLKEFDRQLGALFGAFKGVLWCIVITFFAVTLSEPARQTILKSRSGYYIAVVAERAEVVLPHDLRAALGKYIEELDRKLDPNTPADQQPPKEPSPAVRGVTASCNGKFYYVITQRAGVDDEVRRLPITGNETVLDAIASINGLRSLARKRIWVDRSTVEGSQQTLPVDWEAISRRAQTGTNYQLLPGDRVFVAEKPRSLLGHILDKCTSPLEPSCETVYGLGGSDSTIRGRTIGRNYNRNRSGFSECGQAAEGIMSMMHAKRGISSFPEEYCIGDRT